MKLHCSRCVVLLVSSLYYVCIWMQLVRDVYNSRRQLVTEYSRARCDTTHAFVVPPTTTELAVIRVHRGLPSCHVMLLLLGLVALVAQRPTVVKLSRERSVGPYVRACVRTYVRTYVGLSSALWKNGRSDPDAVWHHRSDGSRDEAGSAVWGSVLRKGYFWGRIWGAPL